MQIRYFICNWAKIELLFLFRVSLSPVTIDSTCIVPLTYTMPSYFDLVLYSRSVLSEFYC